ncbi:protein scarlet isoform X2 [Fopius arisanus]|uniref:Protein scarlet isoform X2 n=1 Tax=Fopius arisanus TaxID=64838 RepID=A0A9R1TWI5_9HYME|nr:PREDICTED: protein scarlet-like isoform X2 [Fopius arisanus]
MKMLEPPKNEEPMGFSRRSMTPGPSGSNQGVTLSWRDLSVYAVDRGSSNICKQIINNVRGVLKPGDLTAILGGSGAGKSSLMTALAYRTAPGVVVHGDIRVNGHPVESKYMKHHSGFMHQEDIFIGTMTVLEHLWFMARMKLDRRIATREVREKINGLLREVGLFERSGVRIGSGGDDKVLSGGEKKRLAFATELLTDPKILFLDEPTTGQDSNSAIVLISHLTAFANRGRTVLCTIHQPSSAIFDNFHRIILVADGRIAFAGTRDQALVFFSRQGYECPSNYNPADFLVATLAIAPRDEESCRRAAQRVCDAFLTSDSCKEMDVTLQLEVHISKAYHWKSDIFDDFKHPRWWTRLFWLTHRGFFQVLRDPSIEFIRILQKLVTPLCCHDGWIMLCWSSKYEPIGSSGSPRGPVYPRNREHVFPDVCHSLPFPSRITAVSQGKQGWHVLHTSLLYLQINIVVSWINCRACVLHDDNLLASRSQKYSPGIRTHSSRNDLHDECLHSLWMFLLGCVRDGSLGVGVSCAF